MKTTIELARESGLRNHIAFFSDSNVAVALHRFAALVLANNPPQSSMAWQEGFEAGRVAEREACAAVCYRNAAFVVDPIDRERIHQCAADIRAGGNT